MAKLPMLWVLHRFNHLLDLAKHKMYGPVHKKNAYKLFYLKRTKHCNGLSACHIGGQRPFAI